MGYLEKLEKNREGYILYCGTCNAYIKQSDPQDFSGGKQVVIESEGCENCKTDILEAQAIMGRLGLPKGEEKRRMRKNNTAFWRKLYFDLTNEVEQVLGKALGYPKYSDDQKNFPGTTEKDGGVRGRPCAGIFVI